MNNIIEKCKKNDKLAKEQLLYQLKNLVYMSIHKYYYGNDNFNDLVQDGYILILQSIDKFDKNKGVPYIGYIQQQLRFLYLNKNKKIKYINSLNYKISCDNKEIEIMELLKDEDVNIEIDLINKESIKTLKTAFNKLPKLQKQVIYMYYYKKMKLKDIAHILNIHYQTVYKLKRKGLKKLAYLLSVKLC